MRCYSEYQSDVGKKNRLEQLVPSSKVIVARKHSGVEIAEADPADILFLKICGEVTRVARTDQ